MTFLTWREELCNLPIKKSLHDCDMISEMSWLSLWLPLEIVVDKIFAFEWYRGSMISSSTLNVGRHGSTHSLQSATHPPLRGYQQQTCPDSPQISHRRYHDTITEGGESNAASEDNHSTSVDGAMSRENTDQNKPHHPLPKKGSTASHKSRR